MSLHQRIIIPLAFTICLLLVRIILTGELIYIFLAWNLFLAWVPFAISEKLAVTKNRWKLLLLTGGWFLFLPNAPYIITDFLHLKHRPPIPYWYDILLLFSAALNGLLLGLLSLLRVEKFLAARYDNWTTRIIISCTLFICAFGIYMGRDLRWNSWDIIVNPGDVAGDILVRVLNPFAYFKTWSITILFGSFLYVIYYSVKSIITLNQNNYK